MGIEKSKWMYLSFALIGILSAWTIVTVLPQANAATTSGSTDITKSIADILRNIQSLLTQSNTIATTTTTTQKTINDPTHGLPGVQAQLDDIQEKLDSLESTAVPGRVITFDNLRITQADLPYEILPRDLVGHGIYVDVSASDAVGASFSCSTDNGFPRGGPSITDGENHFDLACDGLSIVGLPAPCGSTIQCGVVLSGTIRYTNEYLSIHDQLSAP